MNAAYISALSALCGSAIGATASFATTWLTQHAQDRAQRNQREMARREKLFGDFIDEASKLFANALTHSFDDPSRLVVLYGVVSRLRLFATSETIEAADAVMNMIRKTYYQPNLSTADFAGPEMDHLDILEAFTKACRRELI
jgi:hypothetical protein